MKRQITRKKNDQYPGLNDQKITNLPNCSNQTKNCNGVQTHFLFGKLLVGELVIVISLVIVIWLLVIIVPFPLIDLALKLC